ncbi:MAG: hypothetical protein R2911_22715 [Caldilineaceae bacterium]
MQLEKLHAELDKIARDSSLVHETNLLARARALEQIAFTEQVIDIQRTENPQCWLELQQMATDLKTRFEAVDRVLFMSLRMQIQSGNFTRSELRQEFNQFTNYRPGPDAPQHIGYDGLDVLVDNLFKLDQRPEPARKVRDEMVHCELTPARAILDMLDHVGFTQNDIFCDIGSGLGQVVMFVRLLSGMASQGIEYDSAYSTFANRIIEDLNLSHTKIVSGDARKVRLNAPTIFFMFTPFVGEMMDAVLKKLKREGRKRPIKICTYGSCTLRVAEEKWLKTLRPNAIDEYKLAIFTSNTLP